MSAARRLSDVFKLTVLTSLVVSVILLLQYAQADTSYNNQTWNDCGPYGCIGWKNFATGSPSAYIRANKLYDGSQMDQAWVAALNYWTGTPTVVWYSINSTPQNYPNARVVPYRVAGDPDTPFAEAINYDQRPGDGAFIDCDFNCAFAESATAQYGYDLSEIIFYDYWMNQMTLANKEWAARHELGHTVGLVDHYGGLFTPCNPFYFGLMDGGTTNGPCDTNQLTCAEQKGVNRVHDKTGPNC